MRVQLVMLASILTAGCASQPAAPAARVAIAAVPAAPAPANPSNVAESKTKAPSGYTAKTRNGETVYCKNVARIGSNLKSETCITPAQAEEMARNGNFDRQEFSRGRAVCGTGGCGGS
jgi:hypothetical protein